MMKNVQRGCSFCCILCSYISVNFIDRRNRNNNKWEEQVDIMLGVWAETVTTPVSAALGGGEHLRCHWPAWSPKTLFLHKVDTCVLIFNSRLLNYTSSYSWMFFCKSIISWTKWPPRRDCTFIHMFEWLCWSLTVPLKEQVHASLWVCICNLKYVRSILRSF